jgi:pilus assembly protein Flp/PilA
MRHLTMWLLRRRGDEGASAVEYGLLVVAIAAVVVLVIAALGDNVFGLFSRTCDSFSAQSSLSCSP